MSNRFKALIYLMALFVVYGYVSTEVNAADYNRECIVEVGEYTKDLVDAVEAKGGLTNIKLLSPVVNLTYNDGVGNASITLDALAEGAGDAWATLDGIAGNAYNMAGGGTITDYISAARANPNLGGRPLMVTEIGWYPHDTNKNLSLLGSEISELKGDSSIIGALIFNVFGTNPGFMAQAMSDAEISQVCSGSCGKIGANSAKYYTTNEIYPRAGGLGMGYTLEIANIGDGINVALSGVQLAISNGAIPIIRVGVGDDGGGAEDPEDYATYLKAMDTAVSSTVYAIAGPNEPEAETWASPSCDGGGGGGGGGAKITITGKISSSRIVDEAASGGKTAKTVIRPVEGAVIATYEGRGEYKTGKSRGEIQNMFQWTSTNVDGNFLLYARKGQGFEHSNYVAFFCGHELKDLYKLSVDEDIEDFNVTLDCDTKVTAEPPTAFLNYANRNGWLSCNTDDMGVKGFEETPGVHPDILLKRRELDDTYKGGIYNPDPAVPNNIPPGGDVASRRQLDGRFSLKQMLFDPASIRNAIYTIIGSCYDQLDAPTDTRENSLISCNLIKECNNPLLTSAGGTGRNSFLNVGVGLALGFPGQNKKRYDTLPNISAIPVCKDNSGNEVKLSQIQPPWILKKDCGPGKTYAYCPEYFPVWSLFGEPEKKDMVLYRDVTVNDTGENVDDDVFRERVFSGTDKGHQPYSDKTQAIFPSDKTGEFSLPRASCVAGEFCSADLDVPAGVLNYPFTPIGINYDGEKDEDLNLPKVGRGYYRMGLMEALCTCNNLIDPGCDDPMNKWNGEADNRYAGGYSYVTNNDINNGVPGAEPVFYGARVIGGFWGTLIDFFAKFFSHQNNYEDTRGGQCIPLEQDPIPWCDLVNDDDCTATCVIGTDPCDASAYCVPTPAPGLDGDGAVCTYYKLVDGGYTCSGDVEVAFEADIAAEALGHNEVAAGLREISMPFWFPYENRRDVSALMNLDAETNPENLDGFADDKPLYGHDSSTNVGAGVYESDILRATVRDPVFDSGAELNDPNKGIKGGKGGDCTPVATISGAHNVKPVEDLITAIKGTGYKDQVDYPHIRKCYNTVVQTAISSGNDPAFMMATWIEESGAGHPKFKNAAQFGCKVGTPLDFDSQINCFKQLQYAYAIRPNHEKCRERSGHPTGLQVLEYLLIFSEGDDPGCLRGTFKTNPNYKGQIEYFYNLVNKDNKTLNEDCTLSGTTNRWDSTCSSVDVGYCLKPGLYGPTYKPTLDWYTNINSTENDDGLTIPSRIEVLPEVAVKLQGYGTFVGLIRKLKNASIDIVAASGYRNYWKQLQMCNDCQAHKATDPDYPCMVAPAAQSIHRTGRAVDLYYLKDRHAIPIIKESSAETKKIISTASDYGFTHPFGAGDPPHFEYEK